MEILDSLAAETADLGKSFGAAQATLAAMQRELEALREAVRCGKQREEDQARAPPAAAICTPSRDLVTAYGWHPCRCARARISVKRRACSRAR
jgi:hypothetical protein